MPHMSAEIWLKPSFWSKIFDLFHAVKPGFRRVFAKAGFGDAWTLDQNYLSSLVITSSASQGNPFWLILLISVDPLEHLNTGEIVKISANRPRSIVDPFDIEYILITSCNMFHSVVIQNILSCRRSIAAHQAMITNDALLASVKLLASDLDGTLLNPNHVPAARMPSVSNGSNGHQVKPQWNTETPKHQGTDRKRRKS